MNAYHQGQLDFFCAIYSVINAMRLIYGIKLEESRVILATALREISADSRLWPALLSNHTDHHWVIQYMLARFCGKGNRALRFARLPLSPQGYAKHAVSSGGVSLQLQLPEDFTAEFFNSLELYNTQVELGRPDILPGLARAANAPRRQWQTESLWQLMQGWLPGRGLLSTLGGVKPQNRCVLLRFHRFLPYQPMPVISHWSTGREFAKETLMLYDCTANKQAIHSIPRNECALYPEKINADRYLAIEPESLYFLEKV